MKKIFILVAFMVFTPQAFSKGPGHGGKHGGMKLFKQLDLNDEQKEQIKEIRKGNKEKAQSLRETAKSNKEAFKNAMDSQTSNSKLKSLRSKMVKSKQALKDHRFNTMLEIREILTTEQRVKLKEIKSKIKTRRRGGDEDQ